MVGRKQPTARVQVRRVYEPTTGAYGRRVLVDRVWPRGLRRDSGAFDTWLKDVAPTTELRRWYGHAPERFAEFRRRYLAELAEGAQAAAAEQLRNWAAEGPLTLLTAAKDAEHSQAAVLREWLDE